MLRRILNLAITLCLLGFCGIKEIHGQSYGGGNDDGGPDLVSPIEEIESSQKLNVFRVLQRTPFTTFTKLVRLSRAHRQLKDKTKTFTIFVPNNHGLTEFPTKCISYRRNRAYLLDFVNYHIVENAIVWKDDVMRVNQLKLRTISDSEMVLKKQGSDVYIYSDPPNKAEAAFSDWQTQNGILHVIEPALVSPKLPPLDLKGVFDQYGLSEFYKLMRIVSLEYLAVACSKRGVTLFVPNNNAFKDFASALQVSKGGYNTYVEALYHSLGEVKMKMILWYHIFERGIISGGSLVQRALLGKKARMGVKTAREKIGFKLRRINQKFVVELLFGRLFLRSSKIIQKDISSLVGTVHIIDRVMVPRVSGIKV